MIALLNLDSLSDLNIGQVSFRWIHVLAGVLWLGMLWFFNWVNGAFAATLDAETKRKVVPELMPRALFWFRWGAAFTWLTGAALLMLLYYSSSAGYLLRDGAAPEMADWGLAFGALIVGFLVYHILFKLLGGFGPDLPAGLGKLGHALGVLIWGGLAVGFACHLEHEMGYSGRAVMIHVGALFGTSMAANVWMIIWPAQQRIITAIKNGEAPAPADPAIAGLRSKHNTYMSVPLLLLMVSVHLPELTGYSNLPCLITGVLVVGWALTFAIYKMVPSVKGF